MAKCQQLDLRQYTRPVACSQSLDSLPLCSGDAYDDFESLVAIWSDKDSPCIGLVSCPYTNTPAQFETFTVRYANRIYNNYTTKFGKKITGNINDPSYNQFQNYILDMCREVPGACDQFLCQVCNPDDVPDSREYISSNQILLDFCGCNVPPDPLIPDGYPECDPLCTRYGTVKKRDKTTGSTKFCEQDVCAITNVTVSASGQKNNKVSVSQVCSNCSSTICQCIISDISSTEIVDYKQSCGTNSICYVVDPDTKIRKAIECLDTGDTQGNNVLWIIVLVIFVLSIVIGLALSLAYYRKKN